MADPAIVINLAAEFVGNKAFKQADSATNKLSKNVKSLAKTLGVAFSVTAVLAFAKASVRAAAADQKAQTQLALALKNVGLERDAPSAERYIQRLQSEFGVVDDLLRPAYQQLAVSTRSSTEAQRLLGLALDISASTGRDLGSVTSALSRAFLGNNTALGKLGIGITKADLKSKSFKQITDQLSISFKGSAAAAADTYAGSMAKLGVASANVQEIIGVGIIDALKQLGDDNSIDNLAVNMEKAATDMSNFLVGLAAISSFRLGGEQKSFFEALLFPIKRSFIAGPLGSIIREGEKQRRIAQAAASKNPAQSGSYLQTVKKITALTKQQTAAEIAKLKAKKDQAALDKAALALAKGADVFDLDKIQINAALLANQQALNKLGGAGTEQQRLGLANDLVRLTIKQDMLLLEDAIAAKDVAGATALAAKLNKDIAILGVLQGQNIKLLEINKILEAFKPKDLINLDNLNQALALLMAMAGVKISPLATAQATTLAKPFVAGITFNPEQNKDRNYDNNVLAAAAAMASAQAIPGVTFNPNQNRDRNFDNTTINISAGVIAQMDEFTAMVQRAVQAANRNGNNLDVAGVI